MLVILVAIAAWLISSLGLFEASALESNPLDPNVSHVQQYAMRLTPLQTRLLELESLIKDENWSEVKSFLRGPLGDFEIRLRFLEKSLSLSQKGEASTKIQNISKYLTQLDASAVAGNQRQSLEAAYALTTTFDEVLSLAGASHTNPSQSVYSQSSLTGEPANALTQKTSSIPIETFLTPSSETNKQSPKTGTILEARPPNNNLEAELSSSPLGNKAIDDTLSTSQNTMDTNLSPDLTYIALLVLIPLTIYLQIRYQRKHQANQDKVSELEGKIEALNQDKANLGSALEQTQGRLVTMFMDLEETKPVAKLLQQRTITVEEQEELMQENDSFVQALLQQVQETVSPEERHVEG
ncbi:photosystem II protein PsbQ [Acaryochloris thomasi]|nr:hypothetical protein [Acaryochloris thomasi]